MKYWIVCLVLVILIIWCIKTTRWTKAEKMTDRERDQKWLSELQERQIQEDKAIPRQVRAPSGRMVLNQSELIYADELIDAPMTDLDRLTPDVPEFRRADKQDEALADILGIPTPIRSDGMVAKYIREWDWSDPRSKQMATKLRTQGLSHPDI